MRFAGHLMDLVHVTSRVQIHVRYRRRHRSQLRAAHLHRHREQLSRPGYGAVRARLFQE